MTLKQHTCRKRVLKEAVRKDMLNLERFLLKKHYPFSHDSIEFRKILEQHNWNIDIYQNIDWKYCL